MQHPGLMEVVRRDPRFTYEAYEFLFESLAHTQERLGKVPPENPTEPPSDEYHVSGPQLVEGFLDLAKRRFGRLARVVFHMWGIDRTDDVGEMVLNLVEGGLLAKTDNDQKTDFHNLCCLDNELLNTFEISWERGA